MYRLFLGFLFLLPLPPCALDRHEMEEMSKSINGAHGGQAAASRPGERRKAVARPQPEQKMKEAGKSTNGAGDGQGGRRKAKATVVVRPQPERNIECPRCHSFDTKFCYYNNYNLSQPRYHCRGCERYWTVGGALRNVPVGGGRRNRNMPSSSRGKLPVALAAPPASTLAATSSMSMSMADFPNFISPPRGIGELPMDTDLMLPSNPEASSSSSFLDMLRSREGLLDAGMPHNQNNAGGYFAGAGIGMAMPLRPQPPLPFGIGGSTTPMLQPTTAFQDGEELGGGSSSVGAMPLPMSTMELNNWQPQLNGANEGAQPVGVNGVTAAMDIISNTTNGGDGSSRDCYLINNNHNHGGLWQSLMNDSSLM